ncbi:MAG: hypothetical protein SXG53_01715, partial [Pseudomonadota bacterium]|nr:hypothetical protein [Pseudomonadota bacterium]
MKFDRPQAGKPHQLTIYQHVFPVASIRRFCGPAGTVQVRHGEKTFACPPNDRVFCARRSWNEGSEKGAFKGIEDKFQVVASELLNGTLHAITDDHKSTIDTFFALWHTRVRAKSIKASDAKLEILGGNESYSDDQVELLEKNGYAAMRRDGSIAARNFVSIWISLQMGDIRRHLAAYPWRVVRSLEAEFIVPDHPSSVGIVPIAPRMYLTVGERDVYATAEDVE